MTSIYWIISYPQNFVPTCVQGLTFQWDHISHEILFLCLNIIVNIYVFIPNHGWLFLSCIDLTKQFIIRVLQAIPGNEQRLYKTTNFFWAFSCRWNTAWRHGTLDMRKMIYVIVAVANWHSDHNVTWFISRQIRPKQASIHRNLVTDIINRVTLPYFDQLIVCRLLGGKTVVASIMLFCHRIYETTLLNVKSKHDYFHHVRI